MSISKLYEFRNLQNNECSNPKGEIGEGDQYQQLSNTK